MHGQFHFSEGALAKGLDDIVLPEPVLRVRFVRIVAAGRPLLLLLLRVRLGLGLLVLVLVVLLFVWRDGQVPVRIGWWHGR